MSLLHTQGSGLTWTHPSVRTIHFGSSDTELIPFLVAFVEKEQERDEQED